MSSVTGSLSPLREVFRDRFQDGISALAWSSDQRYLAVGSFSGQMKVWDETKKQFVLSIDEAHVLGVLSFAWSGDGLSLASGGCDGKVKIWNLESASVKGEYAFRGGWVSHLLWGVFEQGTQKRDFFIAASGKRLVCLNALAELVHVYPDHPFTIHDLCWRPKSAQFSVSSHGGISLWSVMKPKLERTYEWKNPALFHRWSADGKWIAAGGQDGSIHLWISKSGVDFHMGGYSRKVECLDWNQSGKWLATPNAENLAVWDCSPPGPEGRVPQEFAWHEKNIVSLAYQPSGDLLATGGEEGNVAYWLTEKRDFPVGKISLGSSVLQMNWSPCGSKIAFGCHSGDVVVFAV